MSKFSNPWKPVYECDDDEGNPTVWAIRIDHTRYGKFCWISDVGDGFEVTTSTRQENPIKVCRSLASAKRWVAMNITDCGKEWEQGE